MLDLKTLLKQSFDLYKNNLLDFLLCYAMYFIVNIFLSNFFLLGIVLQPLLIGLLFAFSFHKIKAIVNLNISKLFFDTLHVFVNLFVASLIIFLLTFLGFFLILPAFIVFTIYIFTIPLILEAKMSFWEAMETSRKKVLEHVINYFMFTMLVIALLLLGPMLLGVGVLLTMPLAVNLVAYAYLASFHKNIRIEDNIKTIDL